MLFPLHIRGVSLQSAMLLCCCCVHAPCCGVANYATAKMGIVGLTKTIAKEWGPMGVRCNTIAFGMIDTRLTRNKGGDSFMQVAGKKVALG